MDSVPAPHTAQTRPAPNTLSTLPEILASLASLEDEEARLSESLNALLAHKDPIDAALNRLQSLAPQLIELQYDAKHLSDKVSLTAGTAERVGGRVKLLDEEMRRVREAAERVGQIIELKSSLVDLQFSIDSQDWETATRLCARAMALPLDLITGPFSESAVPTAEFPLPPAQTLQHYREQLRDIFLRHFEEASHARDASATTRFFKLFPPIGWEEVGLKAYAAFVVNLVQTKAPPSAKTSSPLYYVTALTALFESVCSIVDQHYPVVEKYYGHGKMKVVVGSLMQECDKVVSRLLEGWEEERSVKRRIAEVAAMKFSVFPSAGTKERITRSTPMDDNNVDPREIDKLLNEAAAMTMRYSAFRRFLYNNMVEVQQDVETRSRDSREMSLRDKPPRSTLSDSDVQPSASEVADLVEVSGCRVVFDNFLVTYYIPLELWYLRYTINQTHKVSVTDRDQIPPTTTVPDLVFYLLKNVLSRLLSTGSLRAVQGVSKQLYDVIDHDFLGVIKHKLDDVYRSTALPTAARTDKSERDNRLNFMILLNDLEISSAHMERLIRDISSSHLISQNFLTTETTTVNSSFASLLSIVPKMRSTLKAGIEQLFNQLMRPRLRSLIPDVYKDVSYTLDEEGYSNAEYQDLVRKRFEKTWEGLTDGYKDAFTESNFRVFFGLAIDVLIRPWEKYVLTLKYTELGAIRFDRDIRAITTYFTTNYTLSDIREKFQRLQQISMLLNIDREEGVDEFFSSSGISWKLSVAEVRSVVGLKV